MTNKKVMHTLTHWRLPILFALVMGALGAFAGETRMVKHPQPGADLNEKWRWAQDQAEDERHFAVAYETTLTLPEGIWLFGGLRWMNHGGFGRQSIAAMLEGAAADAPPRLIPRRMAVLFRYRHEKLKGVWLTTVDAPLQLDGPLYWLHAADQSGSAAFLMAQHGRIQKPDMAADLIGALGYHVDGAVARFLIGVLENGKDRKQREAAVRALAFQGDPAGDRKLIQLAKSEKDAEVREEAVEALGGLRSDEAFRTLMSLAQGRHPIDIREEAIDALAERRREEGAGLLRELLQSADHEALAEAALDALEDDPEAFDLIVQTARANRWPEVRADAMDALVEQDAKRALPVLKGIVAAERDPEMAAEAVEAMEDLPSELAIPALFDMLDGAADRRVKAEALDTLADFPEASVLARINRFAWESKDPELQEEAVDALGEIELKEARKLLLKLAKSHPNERVREEARDRLKDRLFD